MIKSRKHITIIGSLTVLLIVGAFLVLSSGSSSDQFANDGKDEVTGQLTMLHGETLPPGTPGNEMVNLGLAVTTEDGDLVKVEAPDVEHAHHLVGETVKIEGDLNGNTIVANDITVLPALQAPAPTTKNLAVIMVNFTNNAAQPFTRQDVRNTVFDCIYLGQNCSVDGMYRDMSDGQTTVAGDVFGWFTLNMTDANCPISSIANGAKAALQASGVNLANYQYFTYIFPRVTSCAWAGLGDLPGPDAWINGSNFLATIAHELGHDFGVHHSSAWACTQNGVPVTLSDTCVHGEYSDPFSMMGGGGTSYFDNWHRNVLGWMPDVNTVTTSGTYLLGAATNGPGDNPRSIKIARPNGTSFWLEFDQATVTNFNRYPPGSPVLSSVEVRVAPASNTSQSHLIDATPNTPSWWDGGIAVGQTFNDQYGTYKTNVQITTVAVNPSYATVNIVFGGTPPPTTTTTTTSTTTTTTTVPPTTTTTTTLPPPPPGDITESYDVGDDNNGDGAWASFKLGQTFIASSSHPISKIDVNVFRRGNVTVSCELYNAPAGLPVGPALYSGVVQNVTLVPEWHSCILNGSPFVNAGSKYAIVIRASGGNSSNAVYWRTDTTSPSYIDGNYLRSRSSGAWDIFTSPNLNRDNMFRVFS